MFDRYISVPYGPDGDTRVEVRKFRWVQEVVYRQNEGVIRLRFSKPVLPYLNQLTRQFTTDHLRDVAKMTSNHAIRLYELIMQWRQAGERTVEVQWLKQAFQIEDKYRSIRDLKRFVIDIAARQINEHSPMWLEWDQIKTGRQVTAIHLRFGNKDTPATNTPQQQRRISGERILGIPKTEIERLAHPGET